MPIRFDDTIARFEGLCTIEEAEALHAWLREAEAPQADLATCTGLHGALLQLLLRRPPVLLAPPADPLLAALLPSLPSSAA